MNMEELFNKYQNLIISILIFSFLVYGTYNYIYKPKIKEINSIKTTLKLIDSEIKMFPGGEQLLQDLEGARVMIKRELSDMAKKIPSETETPYLINNYISTVGKGLNIDYNLIQPGEIVPEQKYKRLPLKVEFDGNYANLNIYLSQLKGLPMTIRIDNMDLKKLAGTNKLSVRMILSAFVLPGGSGKPAGEKKAYPYIYDPFNIATKKSVEFKLEGIQGLSYSGYFIGKKMKAIINDEMLETGQSINGFKVIKIYKDRVVISKDNRFYELALKEK
jgi:Tfp pilus assembly protein PilO